MAAKLERTNTPGIFRRHERGCRRETRCECSYVVVWRHRGRQTTSSHRTLAEAREAKGHVEAGERAPASRLRFDAYALDWLEDRDLSPRTRATYRRDLKGHVFPVLGGQRLGEIEAPDVRRLVRTLEGKGLRASSIRHVLAPVKASMSSAAEEGLIRWNPAREVRVRDRRDAPPARVARAMTREELATLLTELPEEWRLFFELLAHTGLRISEAIGLERQHVEFGDRPRLLIRQQDCRGDLSTLKSDNSSRDVPLSPRMAQRLWTLTGRHGPTDRVFTTATGQALDDRNLARRVLEPARERAGMEWVTFHTFRHTCASLLFEADRDVKQVSAWLGHADAAFTLKTYIHLMDSGVGDAQFLDDAVRVNTGSTQGPQTAANQDGQRIAS